MRKVATIFEILAIFGTMSFGLGITLTLKSNAEISSKYVTLYDLAATFSGVSTQTLKNFTVAFAPQPGTYYDLDSQNIITMAQQSIKWLKVTATSKTIRVSAIDIPVNLSKVQNALVTEVGTSAIFILDFQPIGINNDDYKIEISNFSQMGDEYFALVKIIDGSVINYSNAVFEIGSIGISNSIGGISQLVSNYLGNGTTLSRITELEDMKYDLIDVGKPFKLSNKIVGVPVNFIDDGTTFRSEVIKYIPHQFVNVIVASKNIEYGQSITQNMVSQKYLDVYATTTAYATNLNEVIGNVATWSFMAGQVISMQGIQTPPDVVAGQILIAYVSYPSMTVTTFVRAMQSGKIGQIIPVRNVSNGYMMYGLIEKGPEIRIYGGG
jgi:flagella basal body P-ring formation protein FlgA|uniref:Flagellar basal body P-ring formation protein FlgA n=1 Tax=Mesoaciditoga lauensis TaxID=1495039 RepID=A0A7V3RDV7_9BACT